MRTPEEVAREIRRLTWDALGNDGLVEEDGPALADLIRARDAEVAEQVRAATLAQVNAIAQQSALSATDVRVIVDHIERMAELTEERKTIPVGSRVPCDCEHPTHKHLYGDDSPPTHAHFDFVPSVRLVGPWKPDPRTPEQASNEAIDELRRRLTSDEQ